MTRIPTHHHEKKKMEHEVMTFERSGAVVCLVRVRVQNRLLVGKYRQLPAPFREEFYGAEHKIIDEG